MKQREPRQELQCPKCNSPMEKVNLEEIEIDRCRACRGIFFDICEHEDLAALETAAFDEEKSSKNNPMNQMRDYDCPRCQVKMLKLVAVRHVDIQYEKCPHCSGVFFDAREFSEYKREESVFDVLVKLAKGK